jgi:hypothetical protein
MKEVASALTLGRLSNTQAFLLPFIFGYDTTGNQVQ